MTPPPDIWEMIFEQTPAVLRYVLGVLTLGMFTLATWLWKSNRRDVERIERQLNQRMDKTDQRLDTMNSHLITISQNTSRIAQNGAD